MAINDPDSPQVLARLTDEVDAHLLMYHLRSRDIKALYGGEGPSEGHLHGDVQILVRQADLERAKFLSDEFAAMMPRIRWWC